MYHRTNNNMQVSALLDIQASDSSDSNLKEAFADINNRIRAMGLVHQKLYEAHDLSHINLKEYISDLVHLLMTSHSISPGKPTFTSEMEDILVLIDTAIPCGLILNELISNAFKHAFPAGREGTICIHLGRSESGEIHLRFADDGVGVPPGFDFRRDGHLGLQNVFALTENQLRGQVTFESPPGLVCQICFRDDIYRPRV
jgi:two-component sensor histidine kinase